MTRKSMIKVLRYKAEHIKTKITPKFFLAVAEALEQEPKTGHCEDAISRKDVIQLAKESDVDLRYADGVFEFLSLVKNLPSVQPKPIKCEDCISREDALMALTGEWAGTKDELISTVAKRINNCSSVQPKTGHWIAEPNCWLRCSECGEHYPHISIYEIKGSNYCPNCGARMIEPQESEDKE